MFGPEYAMRLVKLLRGCEYGTPAACACNLVLATSRGLTMIAERTAAPAAEKALPPSPNFPSAELFDGLLREAGNPLSAPPATTESDIDKS
uniref:Uncharacterized protein n=1 Tax=Rhizophora mucronata TaxID=61149 RepID=A0A2P2MYC1_RHIMU